MQGIEYATSCSEVSHAEPKKMWWSYFMGIIYKYIQHHSCFFIKKIISVEKKRKKTTQLPSCCCILVSNVYILHSDIRERWQVHLKRINFNFERPSWKYKQTAEDYTKLACITAAISIFVEASPLNATYDYRNLAVNPRLRKSASLALVYTVS